ncbi:MAG: DNA glycosylase AlkZ-like family protein [Actinomycetota bacterium]
MANYLRAYGPATVGAFGGWLAGGWFGTRPLKRWFEELGDAVAEIEVDGEPMRILAEDLDGLMAARPTRAVRFLPGFDQYVLGPGTGDAHVVPARRRGDVSRQSGWIAPVVVAGGVVRGTWAFDGDVVRVEWFGEADPIPKTALKAEVLRLSSITGRALRVESDVV